LIPECDFLQTFDAAGIIAFSLRFAPLETLLVIDRDVSPVKNVIRYDRLFIGLGGKRRLRVKPAMTEKGRSRKPRRNKLRLYRLALCFVP